MLNISLHIVCRRLATPGNTFLHRMKTAIPEYLNFTNGRPPARITTFAAIAVVQAASTKFFDTKSKMEDTNHAIGGSHTTGEIVPRRIANFMSSAVSGAFGMFDAHRSSAAGALVTGSSMPVADRMTWAESLTRTFEVSPVRLILAIWSSVFLHWQHDPRSLTNCCAHH